jgi:hypothetical protein
MATNQPIIDGGMVSQNKQSVAPSQATSDTPQQQDIQQPFPQGDPSGRYETSATGGVPSSAEGHGGFVNSQAQTGPHTTATSSAPVRTLLLGLEGEANSFPGRYTLQNRGVEAECLRSKRRDSSHPRRRGSNAREFQCRS